MLPGFGPGRLLCVRRRGALGPLAARLRLPVGYGRDLVEACGCGPRGGNSDAVRDVAAGGGATVIAAPGSVIRDVIATLARNDAVALPCIDVRKGGVWALFFHRGRLVGADCYPSLLGTS